MNRRHFRRRLPTLLQTFNRTFGSMAKLAQALADVQAEFDEKYVSLDLSLRPASGLFVSRRHKPLLDSKQNRMGKNYSKRGVKWVLESNFLLNLKAVFIFIKSR